jgi:hypothetical protein
MDASTDNLAFSPHPIEAVGLRAGEGPAVQVAMAIVQRTTALRAYNTFSSGRDWMEKLSSAYVVALATRSADTYLMRQIQSCIVEDLTIPCAKCREVNMNINVIRSRLFPELAALRKYANALIHHLDHPKNRGIAELNVQGVFDYCYHLFQANAELLFGRIPEGSFPYMKCKECGAKNADCQ